MTSTLGETCKQEIGSALTEKKTDRKDWITPMSVIRKLAALDPKRCKHCMKKLTTKEMWLYDSHCTKCWRLRGGD